MSAAHAPWSRRWTKLGVHSRAEAVESARTLGLLAPSARSR
jgi:ATP/maltotriose-dependent transcriptional regulator MalT